MKLYEVLRLKAKPDGDTYHIARVKRFKSDIEEWQVYKNGRTIFNGHFTFSHARLALKNTLSRGGKTPPRLDFVKSDRKDIDKSKRFVFN